MVSPLQNFELVLFSCFSFSTASLVFRIEECVSLVLKLTRKFSQLLKELSSICVFSVQPEGRLVRIQSLSYFLLSSKSALLWVYITYTYTYQCHTLLEHVSEGLAFVIEDVYTSLT